MISVVLVENSQIFLDGTIALLEKEEGIQVSGFAVNHKDAVLEIEEKMPDVILVDTAMPNEDGMKTILYIKKNHPNIKVIVVTAFMVEEQVFRAINCGVDGYLVTSQLAGSLGRVIREVYQGETTISGDVARLLTSRIKELSLNKKELFERRMKDFHPQLTNREIEIAYLLLQDYTNTQISNKLYISNGTVKNYISEIYNKIHIHNRKEAVEYLRDIVKM
ncbi:DNA-binding response regulator [Oceanobacillus piezotolerans]|uniref:DNA-binding response regulator n=1 Tax=Oceanobacillus piezotolerans TaxID=2448030 RepID=A0A498DE79_9BACI|nr:response regulator transcription factor [Oceanobacillus piezotolerans]RLL46970.1 DNA-binding response regulator [Oceanobacillus piezotolerans]